MLVAHLDRYDMRRDGWFGEGAARWKRGKRGGGGLDKRIFAAGCAADAAVGWGIGAVEPLEPRRLLALVEWDGGAGTDSWHDALNWSGDAVPTEVDDVVIGETGLGEIRMFGSAAIRSLTTAEDLLVKGTIETSEGVTLNARMTLGLSEGEYNAGGLQFAAPSNQELSGSGEIVFVFQGQWYPESYISAGSGVVLTIGPDITVRGGKGRITGGMGASIINEGTISADSINSIIRVETGQGAAGAFINRGRLESPGGVLEIGGAGQWRFEEGSSLASHGGRIQIATVIDITGRTFALSATTGDVHIVAGGFIGGTITGTDGAGLRVDGLFGSSIVAVLVGVHLDAPMWVYNNAEVRIYDGLALDGLLTLGRGATGVSFGRVVFWNSTPAQTLSGSGEIVFDYIGGSRPEQVLNYLSAAQNVQLTIDEGLTIRGRGGMVRAEPGAVITTHATISADTPGYLFVGQPWQGGMIVNHGRLDASNGGVLGVGQSTGAQVTFGEGTTFTAAGGRLRVRGLNVASSEPIFFDAEVGTLEVSYSTIVGSVISSRGGTVAFGNSTVLDGVVLDAATEIIGGTAIRNGLTLHAPLAFVYVPLYGPTGGMRFIDTPVQFIHGGTTLTFTDSLSSPNSITVEGGVALTIAADILIRGGGGFITALSGGAITHHGTIDAATAGRTIQLIGDITHHGTMRIAAGATIARTGAWVMQESASLQVEIAGTANNQVGRFTATGAVTLNGAVEVSYVNGFVPQRGETFRFVTSVGASGGFDTITTPPLSDADLKSPVLVDAQGVRLIVTHIADFNNDLTVNETDIFAFLAAWFAGDGDFDGDGATRVPDIFVFLSAWYRA